MQNFSQPPAHDEHADDGAEQGVSSSEVVFGIEEITNSFSLDDENRGFRMAFAERNAQGGVHGRRIRWKGYNRTSGADVDAAVANAKTLVLSDRVFALVNFGGPEAMVLADFAERNRVPLLFPHTTLFSAKGLRYVFTSLPHCSGEMRAIMHFAARERSLKRIAILRDTNEYGDIYQELLERHAAEFGYTISGVETVAVRDPRDLSAEFEALAKGSDAIFMALYPPQARAAMAAKAKIGWNGVMIASGPLSDEQYLRQSGLSADGTLGLCAFPNPEESEEPGIKSYREALLRYLPDRTPNRYSLYGYAYGRLIVDALERTGPMLTRETFVQALERTSNWSSGGILPPVSLSGTDHHAQRAALVSEMRNGRFVHVTGWVE